MTTSEKVERTMRTERHRKRYTPTYTEFMNFSTTEVQQFLQRKHSNKRVRRLLYGVHNGYHQLTVDDRDLRSVDPRDRIPRSLEPTTEDTPGYWLITDIRDAVC